MFLWKYNQTTRYWNKVREVTSETGEQWLAVFCKQEPNNLFKLSKSKPKAPKY